ncbi:MAG: HAMP domain-containing histidine kinase [Actinobacteria bacterium]|nr:MAG: HAMP domain-containing histidine kinase [Actinomycetota bacterium]
MTPGSDGARRGSLVRSTRLAFVAVAAASALVVFWVFYVAWTQYTVSLRTTELSRQTVALAGGLSVGGPLTATPSSPDGVRQQLFRVQASLIGARLLVTDGAGAVRVSSALTTQGPTAIGIAALGDADARGVRSAVRTLPGVGRVLIVAVPIEEYPGWLVALQPVSEIAAANSWVVLLLLGSATAAVLVAWVAGSYLAHRLTAPVLHLREGAEAVTAGEWGYQVPVEGDDEIASLAESFNAMSARVADAYSAQKHFVGDVSHELRTPITSIQGFAGALLDGTVEDEATSRRFIGVIRQEAQRLGDLTATLLALADLDAGRVEIAHKPVDATALAESLRARHEGEGASAGLTVRVGELAPKGARPLGDEARVLQVASALITNALRYTPAGGEVVVSAEADRTSWRLLVDDSGPGIAPDDRARIFERFVRLDPSRSATGGGSGLGLSICNRLVTLMDGRIWADGSPLGGARFVVELPRAH